MMRDCLVQQQFNPVEFTCNDANHEKADQARGQGPKHGMCRRKPSVTLGFMVRRQKVMFVAF